MSQISCENLSVGYDNRVVAENIDFTVNAGDYLCIVGENGSGKSTLMKTILGLNKPVKGKITFSDGLKQTEIGYLPQQTIVQRDFPASVYEIVLSGCQTNGKPFYNAEDKKRAMLNMEKMNLTTMKNRSYRELSGGQQQRVLLARALCATKKLLLLDEPVTGLDPKVTQEMYEVIENLNKEGISIIMISHDIGSALRCSKTILHIGHDVIFATKEDYLKDDIARKFVYGEVK